MLYDILFDYQKKTVDELKDFDSCALFYDVGCGKTYTSLALYENKLIRRLVDRLVVICLVSKIEEWKHDIEKWFPFSKVLVMDGSNRSHDMFKSNNWDICLINFEKTWRTNELLMVGNRTMIVIDESHKIKEPTTKIGKYMKLLSQVTPYKVLLTATPMSQGYIDMYNQLYFLGLTNMSYDAFKKKYCIEQMVYFAGMRPFKKICAYKNTDELDLVIKKYARYHTRTIADELLPEEIVVPIQIDNKYNKILKDRVYKDIVMDKVSRKRLADKSMCSGTIMGKALLNIGCNVDIDTMLAKRDYNDLDRLYQLNTYKLDWVRDFLEGFNERVVIYYLYDHQCDQLYDMITKLKRPCARFNGEYKEKEIFEDNDNAVILVQYKSGSTGLDWLKSSYVEIFYTLPDSYIEFYQAKGRINRVGQTKKPLYYILLAGNDRSADNMNYKALKNMTDFNDEFYAKISEERG